MTIVFFGASTVEGVRDSVWGGFVTRLANRAFTERKRARIFNLGIAGDTSREYVNRTEEIAARRADHVVFLLGCNDVPRDRDGDPAIRVPVEEYEANLRRLFGASERRRTLITSFPVDAERTGVRREVFKTYLDAARRAAIDEGLEIVDVYEDWDGAARTEWLSSDGLHLNSDGYEWLADRVYEHLFA